MLSVVEIQFAREQNRRRMQPARSNVGSFFSSLFPAVRLVIVIPGFISLHFFDDAGVRDRSSSAIDHDLITVGVVAVVMRVEGESNGFGCDRANLGRMFCAPEGKFASITRT
jgi:hypothetical protein